MCLLSAVDPRGYSCDCPQGMILGDNNSNCIIQDGIATRPPGSRLGSSMVDACMQEMLINYFQVPVWRVDTAAVV